MKNNLTNKTFSFYRSGVYEGQFIFDEKELLWCAVDMRTRVQLKYIPFKPTMKEGLFDFKALYESLDDYTNASWESEKVKLNNKRRYNRYHECTGVVNGEEITTQLWAERGDGPIMDVVTYKGEIVAFIMTGRISSEMLILDGYENATPYVKYNDERLSKVEYGIEHLGNMWVKTRDGVNLATEVFLPAGAEKGAKFPTIVIRTCYGKTRDLHRSTHWVNRGYAFVIQDVRGRSDSDGELVPFYHERDDAYDLFSWIAEQEWSDGNIGMWGASYLGYTTTAAATSGHPNLKTAISEVNVGSPFFNDTVRRGGSVCSWPLLCWTLAQSMSNRVDHAVFGGITVNPYEVVKMRPITEVPTQAIGKRSGPWDIWSKHYRYDDFWAYCDNTLHAENVKIPMLIMSGWYDGDAMGVQETWKFLTKYNVPNRRIILGAWPHGLNAFRDCRNLEFGNNAIDYDFDTRIIRWFDIYLKGIQNGEDKQPRASYYMVGENEWRHSEDWNPVESTLTQFYFDSDGNANSRSGDGRLLTTPKKEYGSDSYIYDPENTCSTDDGFEPVVLNEQQSRQDCLVYTSIPLKENMAVAGNIFGDFYADSSAVDTDFFLRVSDVDENGITHQLSSNGIRAEFRNWPETPSALLTPGNVEKYHINLHFAGYVFNKGHRISVEICSADNLTFFPNTNTGIDPFTDPKPVVAKQTIYHGEKYPSSITLPILYGEL